MALYLLTEAQKHTRNDGSLTIARSYLNSASSVLGRLLFENSKTLKYDYRFKKGVAGVGSRDVNGALHEGSGSVVYNETVEMKIYNEVRRFDRLAVQAFGNLLEAGIVQEELKDVLESFALGVAYDVFNATKAGGDKFDGLLALAVAEDNVIVVDDGAVAADITKDNVYNNLIALQNKVRGLAKDKVFYMNRDTFTKVQTAMKKSGLELSMNRDDFGSDYATFNGSVIVPLDEYVIDNQAGDSEVKVFIPKATFATVANTSKIVCVNFGAGNIHGVRLEKEQDQIQVKEVKDCKAGEQPLIDLEDGIAICDRVAGSIAVLQGIK